MRYTLKDINHMAIESINSLTTDAIVRLLMNAHEYNSYSNKNAYMHPDHIHNPAEYINYSPDFIKCINMMIARLLKFARTLRAEGKTDDAVDTLTKCCTIVNSLRIDYGNREANSENYKRMYRTQYCMPIMDEFNSIAKERITHELLEGINWDADKIPDAIGIKIAPSAYSYCGWGTCTVNKLSYAYCVIRHAIHVMSRAEHSIENIGIDSVIIGKQIDNLIHKFTLGPYGMRCAGCNKRIFEAEYDPWNDGVQQIVPCVSCDRPMHCWCEYLDKECKECYMYY